MRLKLRSGRALTWIFILGSHVGRHVRQVNRLDVLLHVLLDLVLIEVLKAATVLCVSIAVGTWLLLDEHVSAKLDVSLSSLADELRLRIVSSVVARSSFSLLRHLHSIERCLIVAVYVKDIDDGVGSTHEVWMVRVNVGVLDLDQVAHLCLCGTELLRQQLVHAIDNLLA